MTSFANNLEKLENGATYNTNDTNGVLMSRIETISSGGIDYSKVGYCSTPDKIIRYKMQYGDILFSHINSIKHIGKTAYYMAELPLYHGMNLLLLRCNHNIDSKFFFYLINNIRFLRHCQILAKQAVNQASISISDLKGLTISIPHKDEQVKIQKLLSLIDDRIATQNKIIEKLQSLIKGLNDHILKNIEGDQVCFADLGEAYGGLSGKSGDDFGCGDPFITYMNVYQNTYISENDYELVQIAPDEKQNSVQYGDALFTLSSETPEEVGMGAVYLGKSQKLYLNSFCFGVHFYGNRVLPQYIAHFISSTSFRKAIYPLAQGSTRFNLQKQDFMRMKFVLPSLEEQERIATALDALHNYLANEKLLTEQYLLLKQFLLQQMFI
ncbi:MAG: restriction endonuclease subunit S [Alistipes indistinctus]